jgi:hypothetical protein
LSPEMNLLAVNCKSYSDSDKVQYSAVQCNSVQLLVGDTHGRFEVEEELEVTWENLVCE